jgi:hypothetical protein
LSVSLLRFCATSVVVDKCIFKKSLYTRAFHLRFAICDFRYSFDADDYSHPIWCYSTKTRLRAINILFGGLVGAFNFGNILFYLKAHQAFADNPSTVFAAMNMGVIILGSFIEFFLKKNEPKKLFRTCIRVSLYCINCAVANSRLDCFISFLGSFWHYSPFVKYYNPVQ